MARWWEWEAASNGRRQLTWSTGRRDLRALAGLGREATDEEIAEEDREADVRLTMTAEVWGWVYDSGRACALLAVTEAGGLDAAVAWLRARDLPSSTAENPPPEPPQKLSAQVAGRRRALGVCPSAAGAPGRTTQHTDGTCARLYPRLRHRPNAQSA